MWFWPIYSIKPNRTIARIALYEDLLYVPHSFTAKIRKKCNLEKLHCLPHSGIFDTCDTSLKNGAKYLSSHIHIKWFFLEKKIGLYFFNFIYLIPSSFPFLSCTVQNFKKRILLDLSLIVVPHALFWPNFHKYLAKISRRPANRKN